MNGQACRVQVTTRHFAWGPRSSQSEIANVALALHTFPNIRLRASSAIAGLRTPVEAVISVDTRDCTPNTLEFGWNRRGGVSLPAILGKIAVRRVFGFLRIFDFTAEYEVPADLATRTYDDVVGKWVVLALVERFSKYILSL